VTLCSWPGAWMRRKPDPESATALPARSSGQGARVPAQVLLAESPDMPVVGVG
jgi:hypothetical protein